MTIERHSRITTACGQDTAAVLLRPDSRINMMKEQQQ